MTLALRTPTGYLPIDRATDTEANAALGAWLYDRYLAGCADPTPCVLQAVRLPTMEANGERISGMVALVDADLVVERPLPRGLRVVR